MNNIKLLGKNIVLPFFVAGIVILLNSCIVSHKVKGYPNQPFVYETSIKIVDSAISKDEKTRLETGLYEQLDDSIKNRHVDKLFWTVLKNPPALDSSTISKSIQFMHYYMDGEGYFNDSINFTTNIKAKRNQQRTYISFNVFPGRPTRIDSLNYQLRDGSLQAIVDSTHGERKIRKGDLFAQGLISTEMDRLVDLFRNEGYFKFSRDMVFGLWDTLDISLLKPSFDPLEQLEQLERIKARRLNPTANLDIRLRPIEDSSRLRKYYIGNIIVFPDIAADGALGRERIKYHNGITIIQSFNKFKNDIFDPNIYFRRGELYSQRKYLRTINRFNTLGSWRLVDIRQVPRKNEDSIDITMRLIPAKKYSLSANLEGNLSQSNTLSNNYIGIGINFGLQNKNFMKGANLATTNLRYGVEVGLFGNGELFQSHQISIANSISYPRFVFPGMLRFKEANKGMIRTLLSLNGANTERNFLFNLTTLNGSWGYELARRKYTLGIRLPNFEYAYIVARDSLYKLIIKNPSIATMFTDGFVSSAIINYSRPWSSANSKYVNLFRTNVEESGLLTGLIRNKFLDSNLYRFIKLDAEYSRLVKYVKSSLVLRGFVGIGYEFNFTRNPEYRNHLPFFKQFYSGGPNSMRAWQLRRLGPGSVVQYFRNDSLLSFPDRFGDLQLEANIEYRRLLFKISDIAINGALFTDIGNVWYLKKEAGSEEEVFKLSRLGKDIAIGAGAGLRVDLGFLVIRLDYAYKVKDPSPSPDNARYQNKFFSYPFFKGSQLQIGIGYPFIF